MEIGTRIEATAKSKHSGQIGTVVADYGNYLLVQVDNPSYDKSFKSSGREGKYLQLDSRCIKELPNAKD